MNDETLAEGRGLENPGGRRVRFDSTADTDLAIGNGAFVAVVQTSAGHNRRNVFLSLRSAERAVDRSRANGHRAELIVCELIPVADDRPRAVRRPTDVDERLRALDE